MGIGLDPHELREVFGEHDPAAHAEDVERRFAEALAVGVPADSKQARALAEEHRAWVGCFYDCSHEMHASLADMYVSDERFTTHYDRRAVGLAQYVHDAVHAHAVAG